MEQLQKIEKRSFSWSAIASVVFGIMFLTGAGLLAIPLGVIGLIRTRDGVRRGRKAAKWGLGLGFLALFVNIMGCPGVIVPPPICVEDWAFARFIDDLSNSNYQQLRGNIRIANSKDLSDTEFARWVDAFNEYNGPGRMLWPAGKIMICQDSPKIYIIHFQKTGNCTVTMMYDDSEEDPIRVLFFPSGFPNVRDLRFSDEYHDDPEFREMFDN